MMKPHVWSPQFWGENARWRGDLRMTTPRDWEIVLLTAPLPLRAGVRLLRNLGNMEGRIGISITPIRSSTNSSADW